MPFSVPSFMFYFFHHPSLDYYNFQYMGKGGEGRGRREGEKGGGEGRGRREG